MGHAPSSRSGIALRPVARSAFAASIASPCVSIGVRPTFGTGRAVLVEAYLIDRDEDLYGRTLALDFLERLRGERRFSSKEELIEQMRLDVQHAREICG